MSDEVVYAAEILELLPHRYPFLLIDRIIEHTAFKRAVGIKCVTMNEPFFQGHFPGAPIMPGVLVQEAMVQVAATIALKTEPGYSVALLGVDKFRMRKPVIPGDQLRIEATVTKVKGAFWKFHAQALVEGKKVAEGDFLASISKEGLVQ